MATKKILLVLGQSNAGQVADAPTWETENKDIALRSTEHLPSAITQFAMGSSPASSKVVMPDTFAGGQQSLRLGNGTKVRPWQTYDLRGSALDGVRYLTFYNPSASYANAGTGNTTTYPGVGAISFGFQDLTVIDGSYLRTTTKWQPDVWGVTFTVTGSSDVITVPSGHEFSVDDKVEVRSSDTLPGLLEANTTYYVTVANATDIKIAATQGGTPISPNSVGVGTHSVYRMNLGTITRRRTGTQHEAWMTFKSRNGLYVDPPMADPVPEVGELFDYPIVVGDVSNYASSPRSVRFLTSFGGLTDVGSLLDGNAFVIDAATRLHGAFCGSRVDAGGNPIAGLVFTPGRPPVVGHPVQFFTGSSLPPELNTTSTYYVHSIRDPDRAVSGYLSLASWDAGANTVGFGGHGLITNERVRLSGTLPPELSANTDYYVVNPTYSTFQLAAAYNGAAIDFSAGGGAATLTRVDAPCQFTISATPGGPPIEFSTDGGAAAINYLTQFRGSLTGCVLRATSGANDGDSVPLADVFLTSPELTNVELGDAFGTTPSRGDTFVIEPPSHNGTPVPWEKWAYFLPASPFEGDYEFPYVQSGMATSPAGAEATVTGLPGGYFKVNDQVRLFAGHNSITPDLSRTLPSPFVHGRRYYVHSEAGGSIFLKETIDGDAIIGDGSPSLTDVGVVRMNQEGRRNAAPPGFNNVSHHVGMSLYQAFSGVGLLSPHPRQCFHLGLSASIHDNIGETVYTIAHAVGGTSLAYRDVIPQVFADLYGFGWYDPRDLLSWSKGDGYNCYGRLEEILDAAVIALEKTGDTGEVIGIVFAQGEQDAADAGHAARYYENASRFKSDVRALVKAKGLCSKPADQIPWVHPKIATQNGRWPYADTVNAAIVDLVDQDPYMATCEVSDLTFMDDGVHYDGASMSLLGDRIYEAWKTLVRSGTTEVDICNQALANLGVSKTITSIYPPDGSFESEVCARFFESARDDLLSRHNWDFASKRTSSLVSVENTRVDQWAYAFRLPANATDVIELLHEGAADDVMVAGEKTQIAYTVELDSTNRLILYCNDSAPVCRYKVNVVDPTKFSALFSTALSWAEAGRIAGPLVKGEEAMKMVQLCERMVEYYVQRAKQQDAKGKKAQPDITTRKTDPWGRR